MNFVSHHQIKQKTNESKKNPFLKLKKIESSPGSRELTGLGLLGGGDEVDWATKLMVWWWWWGCCGGGAGGGISAEDWI